MADPDSMVPVHSFEDLLDLLARDGVIHQADRPSRSVQIPTEVKGITGSQVVRWHEGDGVLQFIQSLPVEVPEQRLAALESAIARLNHALAWPGLSLDHERSALAFRVVLPVRPRGAVEPREIQACFRVAVHTAADLLPTLRRVSTGEIAPAQAVADAARELRAATTPPGEPPYEVD